MTFIHPRSRTTRNFQLRSPDFTLSIFSEDFIRIGKLVSEIPYAETGGNLFGLWTNKGNAVVLVATGPGKNCKRSSASFYQDIPYMQRVGNLLTCDYPLCHIGEWHSHHQMQLYEPSYGDCNTVQRNYPTGSQGFVLMIANILQDGMVKLSPYKFTDDRSPYIKGDIELMAEENPFMRVGKITSAIKEGKEKMPQKQLSGTLKKRDFQGARDSCSFELKNNYSEKRPNIGNSSCQRSRSRSRSPIKNGGSSTEEEDIDFRTNRPTRRGPATAESAAPIKTSYDYEPQQSPAARRKPTVPSGEEKFSSRNLTTQWYDTELDTLQTTWNFVTSLADDPRTVELTRDRETLNLTTKFTHHDYKWSITYPCDFPRGSVELKKSELESGLYKTNSLSVEGRGDIHSFKNNLESTLRDQCTQCKRVVSYNDVLGRQERHEGHQRSRGEKPTVQWYEKQPNNALKRTFDFVTSLADGKRIPKISREQSTQSIAMEFTHHNRCWVVEFPPNFPTGKVTLNTKDEGYTRSYTYSYTNSFPLYHSVEAGGDVNKFMNNLKSVLHNNCEKCKRNEQNYKYTRNM